MSRIGLLPGGLTVPVNISYSYYELSYKHEADFDFFSELRILFPQVSSPLPLDSPFQSESLYFSIVIIYPNINLY